VLCSEEENADVATSDVTRTANAPSLPVADQQRSSTDPEPAVLLPPDVSDTLPAASDAATVDLPANEPYHPDVNVVPKQTLKGRTLSFRKSWFEDYPWLHYQPCRMLPLHDG